MIKYVKSSEELAPDYLWNAVCSGDITTIKEYYRSGGKVNLKYPRFGTDHSLIMGAVRNKEFEAANLLADYGENISHKEAKELYELEDKLLKDAYKYQGRSEFYDSLVEGLADLMDKLGM